MKTISSWLTSGDLFERGLLAFGVLFWLLTFFALVSSGRLARWPRLRIALLWGFRLACATVLGLGIAQAGLYASHAAFFDPYEASVASVSGLVGVGAPLFHGPGDPVRYVQIGYGPMLYLINYVFIRAFGLTIQACKLASVTSYVASLLFMARAFHRDSSRWSFLCPRGLGAAVALAVSLGYFGHWAFWTRADPHIVLCVVLGIWALEERRFSKRAKALVLGLALGVAVNLKFTACLYFFPLFVLGFFELGWRNMLLFAAVAAAAAIFPFLLPSVSFRNYLHWLAELRKQGLGGEEAMIANGKRALFYATPLAASWLFAAVTRARLRQSRLYMSLVFSFRLLGAKGHCHFAAIVSAFGLLVIVASKPGATEHHFVPFFPVLIHGVFRMVPRAARGLDFRVISGLSLVLVFFGSDWNKQLSLWHTQMWARPGARATSAEVTTFLAQHPGKTVEMGAGGSLSPTFYRPILVYAKQPYTLDVGTLSDLDSVGSGRLPAAIVKRIERCVVDYFLIAKGAQPFKMKGIYTTGRLLFQSGYPEAFAKAYEKTETLVYYDVYACRKPTSEAPSAAPSASASASASASSPPLPSPSGSASVGATP